VIELTAFANAENLKSDAVFLDIVRMSGVRFTWPGRNAFSLAIDDFSLKKGERLLLIGPSGSGKSTFFRRRSNGVSSYCGFMLEVLSVRHKAGHVLLRLLPQVRIQRLAYDG